MELFTQQNNTPVWVSFENPGGQRGKGGTENSGAKGHPFERLCAGEEKVLCDLEGPAAVRRLWLTLNDRSPEMLAGVRLNAYWDGAEVPSFSVPIGDFFCMGNGHMLPFENALFASPEGRSFVCMVPMPFLKRGKLTLHNTTDKDNSHLFYDIDLTREVLPADTPYFYAIHTVTDKPLLGQDVPALPFVKGSGRFLGMNIAVRPDPVYGGSWWGEGEVKLYLDGEKTPSLVGTGMEDYLGTAWGQGEFINRHQGCTLCTAEEVSFYRLHLRDPIYFTDGLQVEVQDIGGCPMEQAKRLLESGAELIPVGADPGGWLIHLYKKDWCFADLPESSFITFYRRDRFAVTAYCYLSVPPNFAG